MHSRIAITSGEDLDASVRSPIASYLFLPADDDYSHSIVLGGLELIS